MQMVVVVVGGASPLTPVPTLGAGAACSKGRGTEEDREWSKGGSRDETEEGVGVEGEVLMVRCLPPAFAWTSRTCLSPSLVSGFYH